jgi:hypothetical protein
VRHEDADAYGAVRLLRGYEVVPVAAEESGATGRGSAVVTAGHRDDRAGTSPIGSTDAWDSFSLTRVPGSAAFGAFAAAAGALLHVSHLIHGR